MAPTRTSFLIPVRNAEQTIEQAIRSTCKQTDPEFEVLVINDNSQDESRAIAAAIDDPRIRVLDSPGRGLVDALNYGLSQAQGQFIARMDADDLAIPIRLERQLPQFDNPRLAVIDGQVRFRRVDGLVPQGMTLYQSWINEILTPEDFDRELLIESPIVHPAATYRRDLVQSLGGYRDGPFPEDYDLWLRIHAAGYRLQKVPEILVEMLDHEDRLTRTDPRYNHDGFRYVRQQWLQSTHLATPKRVVLFGAGKESGPWIRWLLKQGHLVPAIVDVSPGKIGRMRLGIPIISIVHLTEIEVDFGLFLASTRGSRALIRTAFATHKPEWIEGQHWWAVR